jgi:hypothetical protein
MQLDRPQPGLPNLRQVVSPTLAALPDAYLIQQVDGAFGDGFAEMMDEDLENIFKSIGRGLSSAARDVGQFAQKAAPIVGTIGGGIVQGAMAGSAAGLPGIIAGGLVGGTGAGLSRYGSGAARTVGNVLSGVTQTVGQFTPMGQKGAALGSVVQGLGNIAGSAGNPRAMAGHFAGTLGNLAGSLGGGGKAGALGGLAGMLGGRGGGAAGLGGLGGGGGGGAGGGLAGLAGMLGGGRGGAAQALGGLLSSPQLAGLAGNLFGGASPAGQMASLLQRPETQQALAAQRLGPLGRTSIPVGAGQMPVPTAAFTQLLGHLAQQVPAAPQGGEAMGDAESLYFMQSADGEFLGDPVDPTARSARLWDMLNDSQADRLIEMVDYEIISEAEADAEFENEAEGDNDWLDALDLADAGVIDSALEMEAEYAW